MFHLHSRRHKKPGAAPGTLVYQGEEVLGPPRITVFDFTAQALEEKVVTDVSECARFRDPATVTWLDIEGVHDVDLVARLGPYFDIHPLTLEDIVHTRQRPKMEEYPQYIYVVLKMLHYHHETCELADEQVSLVLGPGYVISFQEAREGDVFDPVRLRLREARGRIRKAGADYLAYALIDLIVDYYLDVLEGLGEHIEALEDRILGSPDDDVLRQINKLRRHVLFMRRSIWPLRDVIMGLERSDLPFMHDETHVFFRDVYDHTMRTTEIIEASREVLASMIDLHMSALSNRMNEVMKVLAIISTFFLPLTFIAGVYGMNFNPEASPLNMPELNWFWGYPFSLALMAVTALWMYVFFRRKNWL